MHSFNRAPRRSYRADVVVYDPEESRVEVIVEVKQRLTEAPTDASRELREAMLWVGCHHGILVTPDEMYVWRDTFDDDTVDAIRQDHPEPLPTPAVLGRFAAGKHLRDARVLELAVAEWLEALSKNWYETLPAEYIEAFLPEFVGSVAEGKIRLEEEIPFA